MPSTQPLTQGRGACRQNDQRELRRQRKRLRDLCAAESADAANDSGDAERLLEADDVEELCRELPRAMIEDLCKAVEGCDGGEDAKRALLEAALTRMYESRGEVRRLRPNPSRLRPCHFLRAVSQQACVFCMCLFQSCMVLFAPNAHFVGPQRCR